MSGIVITANFTENSALPLDDRDIVADQTARNAIVAGRRYEGMKVYSIADFKTYQLQGGILDANWTDVSGSGGVASAANALTANAGGGQALALALTSQINRVTTVATAGDSVKLPAATAGLQVIVINDGGKAMDVFPVTGESIDSLAVNAAFSITPTIGNTRFICPVAGLWKTASGGGSSAPTLFGTYAVGRSVDPLVGVTAAASHMSTTAVSQRVFIVSTTAAAVTDLDSGLAKQLDDGTVVGQQLTLIGTSDTAVLRFLNGQGLNLNGDDWLSFNKKRLTLEWDGSIWVEISRRD